MMRFYPIVILLQLFCIYHAYSGKTDQKWYWIIIIFPFFGSLVYLYDTFYNRRNVEEVTEGIKNTFVSNYNLEKLEKQMKFTDTVANRIELADEHATLENYKQALELYKSCDQGNYKDDPYLLRKIIRNSYLNGDYKSTVEYGDILRGDKAFVNSEERTAYAWAQYHLEDFDAAKNNFQDMNITYSNYENRLQYAHFLQLTDKADESKMVLEILLDEIESMDAYEKRLKKEVHKEIKGLYKEVGG